MRDSSKQGQGFLCNQLDCVYWPIIKCLHISSSGLFPDYPSYLKQSLSRGQRRPCYIWWGLSVTCGCSRRQRSEVPAPVYAEHPPSVLSSGLQWETNASMGQEMDDWGGRLSLGPAFLQEEKTGIPLGGNCCWLAAAWALWPRWPSAVSCPCLPPLSASLPSLLGSMKRSLCLTASQAQSRDWQSRKEIKKAGLYSLSPT